MIPAANASLISIKRGTGYRDDYQVAEEGADPVSTIWSPRTGEILKAAVIDKARSSTSSGTLDHFTERKIYLWGWIKTAGEPVEIEPGDKLEIKTWGEDDAETYTVSIPTKFEPNKWTPPRWEIVPVAES